MAFVESRCFKRHLTLPRCSGGGLDWHVNVVWFIMYWAIVVFCVMINKEVILDTHVARIWNQTALLFQFSVMHTHAHTHTRAHTHTHTHTHAHAHAHTHTHTPAHTRTHTHTHTHSCWAEGRGCSYWGGGAAPERVRGKGGRDPIPEGAERAGDCQGQGTVCNWGERSASPLV